LHTFRQLYLTKYTQAKFFPVFHRFYICMFLAEYNIYWKDLPLASDANTI